MRKGIMILAVASVVITTTAFAYTKALKSVVLVDEGVTKEYKTFNSTVDEFLKEQGVTINPADDVNVDVNTSLNDKNEIIIDRAEKINFVLNGETEQVETTVKTVQDLLASKNITVAKKDVLSGVALTDTVEDGMTITLDQFKEEVISTKRDVNFSVKYVDNHNLAQGKTRVVKQGQKGQEEVKLKVSYVGKKKVAEQQLSKKTTKQPVQQVVERGTAKFIKTSRGTFRYSRALTMRATGYTTSYADTGKNPGDAGYGVTATGMKARYGVVAVDPRVIPLGTRLYIEGYGYAIAGDTGGAIKGNKIDLYFNSRSECLNFGVRSLKVYIID